MKMAHVDPHRALVTGGAGFIGGHLISELLEQGYDIKILDNLEPQVHGNISNKGADEILPINLIKKIKINKNGIISNSNGQEEWVSRIPSYIKQALNLAQRRKTNSQKSNENERARIEFVFGDVRNKAAIKEAVKDVSVVYHLAAAVGVGQSMYQIDKYININAGGTANLLDVIINTENDVKKVVTASSNTIYGEGSYKCTNCGVINPDLRSIEQMRNGKWELLCPHCSNILIPIPTNEDKPINSTSIYALSKEVQEKQTIMIGKTYGLDTTALRFFLVYGSHQSLSNPYTGVCAIFSNALLNNQSPMIYEDGKQSRDFVHVKDVVQALLLVKDRPEAQHEIFNVGTGQQITIKEVAEILCDKINPKIRPIITGKFRKGDIRHCFPDISKIRDRLGYKPQYDFKSGIDELIEWIKSQKVKPNLKEKADMELAKRGLI